jgi:hypothetical protein
LDYRIPIDLSTANEADIQAAIVAEHPARATKNNNGYRSRVANILTSAVKHLVVGSIAAIKKGKSIQMFVRISGSYRYEPGHPSGCPHRWNYTLLRAAHQDEQHYANCSIYDAYEYCKVPLPEDLATPTPLPSSSNSAADPEPVADNTLHRRIAELEAAAITASARTAELEAAAITASARTAELEARIVELESIKTTFVIRGGAIVSISTA